LKGDAKENTKRSRKKSVGSEMLKEEEKREEKEKRDKQNRRKK
jgi:hypothetical protein